MSDPASSPTPNRTAIHERLRDLLHEITGVAPDAVGDDTTIDEHLQLSSLAFVELQVAIEDEYGIELDTVQVVELNRFALIVDYVHELALRAAA